MQKKCKVQIPNLILTLILTFKSLDPKINRGTPQVMGNTCVKYHLCMSEGNRAMGQKLLFHRRTDSQPAMVRPVCYEDLHHFNNISVILQFAQFLKR